MEDRRTVMFLFAELLGDTHDREQRLAALDPDAVRQVCREALDELNDGIDSILTMTLGSLHFLCEEEKTELSNKYLAQYVQSYRIGAARTGLEQGKGEWTVHIEDDEPLASKLTETDARRMVDPLIKCGYAVWAEDTTSEAIYP